MNSLPDRFPRLRYPGHCSRTYIYKVKQALLTSENKLRLSYEDGEGKELAAKAAVSNYEELMERGNATNPEAVKYAVYRVLVGGMPPGLCLLSEELPDSNWRQGS